MRAKGRFERVIFKGILWAVILALVGLIILLSGSTWEVFQKERGAKKELNAALFVKADLEKRQESLSAKLAALKTERGMEAEFRERFPVAKAGEEVIILIDPKPATASADVVPQQGLWSKIRAWFGW